MSTNKELLMKSILELVREYGYKNTSTKKIAELTQVNEVTLFRTFGSKKELFLQAIYNETIGRSDIDYDAISNLPTLSQRINALLHECLKISYKQAGIFRAIMTYSDLFPTVEKSKEVYNKVSQLIEVMFFFFQTEYEKGNLIEFDFYTFSEMLFSRILLISLEYSSKQASQSAMQPNINQFVDEYTNLIITLFSA